LIVTVPQISSSQRSPVKGATQLQLKVLIPSMQVPPFWQPFGMQSSIFVQPFAPTPLPEWSGGQLHVLGPPCTFWQVAMGMVSQPPLLVLHSSMSTHAPPAPGLEPAGHDPHE
jgi:hypothetical protein